MGGSKGKGDDKIKGGEGNQAGGEWFIEPCQISWEKLEISAYNFGDKFWPRNCKQNRNLGSGQVALTEKRKTHTFIFFEKEMK